jgi:hypothetical protein
MKLLQAAKENIGSDNLHSYEYAVDVFDVNVIDVWRKCVSA